MAYSTIKTLSALAVSLCAAIATHAAPTIQLLGIEGGPAPGFSEEWRSNGYQVPALNNNGQVAVAGFAERGPTGSVEGAQAVWVYEPNGQAQLIVREGDTLAGAINNTVLETAFNPAVNDQGQIVFQANLINPNDLSDTTSRQALIQADPILGARVIAQQGQSFVAPNGLTTTIRELRNGWGINQNGTAIVFAIVESPGVGAFGTPLLINETGITPVAFAGQTATGFNDGTTFEGGSFPSFNDSDQAAYLAVLNNTAPGTGDLAIIGPTPAGTGPLAQTFTNAPGFSDGSQLQTFWNPVTNNAGQTAFLARARLGIGSTAQDTYVIYRSNGTTLETIAVQGQAITGLNAGETVGTPSIDVKISANGGVSFSAQILDTNGQPFPDEINGFFGPRNGQTALLARDGQAAPGVDDGALFDLNNTSPIINANGDIAFIARLMTGTGPEVTTANDSALFFYDANTDLIELVLREGDLVDIDLDPNNEILSPVRAISLRAQHSGEGRNVNGFNDNGWLATELTFGVATSGIYLIDPRGGPVPEPTTASLLLATFLLAVTRRRNNTHQP